MEGGGRISSEGMGNGRRREGGEAGRKDMDQSNPLTDLAL